MTRARSELLDASKLGTYHLITRCVRRERLLDRGERKQWLCRGLAGWFGHMAIDLPVPRCLAWDANAHRRQVAPPYAPARHRLVVTAPAP